MNNEVPIVFTVVIPTYNRVAFIEKAIDSVLNQSFNQWELIVVDDASTDNTPDVLKRYVDPRIRVYRNEVNLERSASRNKGIDLARGEYVCFLDSDDFFYTNHLKYLYDLIQASDNKIALFYSQVEQFQINDNIKLPYRRIITNNVVESVISSHIPVIAVAVHISIIQKIKFETSMKINEDVYLFARIASVYPIRSHDEVTVAWVIHDSNTIHQEKDYLTPQLTAADIIFGDMLIKPNISELFKRNRYFDLYSALIFFYAKADILKSIKFLVKAMVCIPSLKRNRNNILNVIYNLPGGILIKRLKAFFVR